MPCVSYVPWSCDEDRAAPSGRTERRVLLAKPRGYCAGVDRAVQAVEMALDRFGPPVYVRRQIVHNTHVVSTLERARRHLRDGSRRGAARRGRGVLRARHRPGGPPDAERRGLRTIDATCPLVTKVHNEARRFAAKDYDILLVGHEGHEEVVGTAGEAPSRVRLVDGADGAAQVEVRDPSKVVWLSQTTLSVDETDPDRQRAARALPGPARPAERRHLLRHPEPPGRGQGHRGPGRPGHRGGLAELLELGPAGRGGQGLRRPGRPPGR